MAKNPRYQIVIDGNGDTARAFMVVNGVTVKKTESKRNPADKFSLRIGAETAFNRLFEKQEKEEKPKPFKVGDRVVCIDVFCDNTLVRGAHGTIRDVYKNDELFGIEFDKNVNGHGCNGQVKFGHGWWCTSRVLMHEQEAK